MESKYKRIVRFFKQFTLDYAMLARWIMYQFGLDNQPVYLSMDRTYWKFGKKNINIFMLSIVYKGIGIPLMWKLLDKRGNSNTDERIDLITRFINTFGKEHIAGILADREFVGGDWFEWLIKHKIPFCTRIKSGNRVIIKCGKEFKEVSASSLFRHLQYGEVVQLSTECILWGNSVFLSATRSLHGELVIVATDRWLDAPLELYRHRWQVETLFAALKSRGFNFEQTHLTHIDRLEKLIAVLALAFCWAHKIGEWRHSVQPIPLKKHGRRLYSYVRYGIDFIRSCLRKNFNCVNISDVFAVFLPPPYQSSSLPHLEGSL